MASIAALRFSGYQCRGRFRTPERIGRGGDGRAHPRGSVETKVEPCPPCVRLLYPDALLRRASECAPSAVATYPCTQSPGRIGSRLSLAFSPP